MSEFTEAVEHNLRGCDAFSVGACEECEECEERPGEEEGHFSWSECDSCGSTLGGDRHAAHWLYRPGSSETTRDGKNLRGTVLIHCEVCVDCLVFHANGDEPEEWGR